MKAFANRLFGQFGFGIVFSMVYMSADMPGKVLMFAGLSIGMWMFYK